MPSSTDLMIELHSDHARALWGFALRLTGGDRAHAEDVVQETLLRAWRDRDILQSTTAGARAWSLCSSIIRSVELDMRHLLPGETGRDAERFTARG